MVFRKQALHVPVAITKHVQLGVELVQAHARVGLGATDFADRRPDLGHSGVVVGLQFAHLPRAAGNCEHKGHKGAPGARRVDPG